MLTPNQAAARTPYSSLHNQVVKNGVIPQIHNMVDRDQVLCLALNVYHEIRGGTNKDKLAVAQTTINRTHRREFKSSTLCGVVWATGQYSWTRWNTSVQIPKEKKAWMECQELAYRLFHGVKMNDPTNGATHFYQARLNPGWARTLQGKIQIGDHMFARLPITTKMGKG